MNGPPTEDFRFLLERPLRPGEIATRWVPGGRRIDDAIERQIDAAWQKAIGVPGVKLFDGPVCRFESFADTPSGVVIDLSPCSYRVIVGTHFDGMARHYASDLRANPLGVSTGLLSADGYLNFGRRNKTVAYYPERVHPFAGSIEVEPVVDLFENVRRELAEELSLAAEDINDMTCLGLAEDCHLCHPEALFMTETSLDREQLRYHLQTAEHEAIWSVAATSAGVESALRDDASLTPIARAILWRWLRYRERGQVDTGTRLNELSKMRGGR